jgi:diadenosine tetraphosphate (Ap4A) HIT family hydrolase
MIIALTGPTGVGKTDTSWALVEQAPPMVFLDCDWFAARIPFSWKLESDVESVYQALSVMLDFHTSRAAARFVIPLTLEMAASYARNGHYLERFGLPLFRFRLSCSADLLRERVLKRDRNPLQRSWELEAIPSQLRACEALPIPSCQWMWPRWTNTRWRGRYSVSLAAPTFSGRIDTPNFRLRSIITTLTPNSKTGCELCEPKDVVFESDFAYVRYDSNSLSPGHVIVVPRRHVADFFDMSAAEQGSVIALLNRVKRLIDEKHKPDGYNIGVNVGKAAGQARMHVHLHLIPRYAGDVPDPRGGIRCVLARKK